MGKSDPPFVFLHFTFPQLKCSLNQLKNLFLTALYHELVSAGRITQAGELRLLHQSIRCIAYELGFLISPQIEKNLTLPRIKHRPNGV